MYLYFELKLSRSLLYLKIEVIPFNFNSSFAVTTSLQSNQTGTVTEHMGSDSIHEHKSRADYKYKLCFTLSSAAGESLLMYSCSAVCTDILYSYFSSILSQLNLMSLRYGYNTIQRSILRQEVEKESAEGMISNTLYY